MEDLEDGGSPILDNIEEPQGNQDPGDPLQPEIEEEHEPNAPISDPTADPDVLEDGAPDEQADPDNDPALDIDPDEESELDELDEAQFDDFDAEAANIVVPVAVDETNVGQLGVHKRKRTEEEERERKRKKGGSARAQDEETLTPEERRRRALERKMDEALRTNKPSRKRGQGIDVQDQGDQDLMNMRSMMVAACRKDSDARKGGEPASHKLILLPKVVELLNRNTLKQAILDPEIDILSAVRLFLEPAEEDAALPNYQIQRELFKFLTGLQMTKEALLASHIGKVIMFYTKSDQPQATIKRQAEKLLQSWMGVVLNRKRSSKAQQFEKRQFDPVASSQRAAANPSQLDRAAVMEEKRRKALQAPGPLNRARVEGGLGTYTITPVNTLSNQTQVTKRMGAGGEAFKRLAARIQPVKGGVGRK
ncbi:hypothetical protein AMS68_007015 [Peltaster fructicola]|uniref:TFIIS N-terminal domain-containing protein n=1 Tax=Peltaster fructicola TaxID=286661 RepID=A0A6H0Y3S9_9PEZI|nr:hypothetical protein AMS68_007015 [Peltaster fructicola]